MSAKARWFTTVVLYVSMGLFATSAPAQTGQATSGSGNGGTQATQSPNGSPPETSSSKASTKSSETPSPTLSLGDIARKAKLKNQEGQNNGQTNAVKPRVFTNDDLPAFKTAPVGATPANLSGTSAAAATKVPALQTKVGAANIVITKFEPEKPTIKRPGGAQMNWMIENHSDHLVRPTVTFIVTGPCNYKFELPTNPELGAGYGLAHTGFQVALNESDCPGQYSLELRITLDGQLVTASSSVNVQ